MNSFLNRTKFFGFRGLSDESVNQSLLSIGARGWSSVPFSYVLFWVLFYRHAELRHDAQMFICFMLLNLSTVVRFVLKKYGRQIIAAPNGQRNFRALFTFSGLCIGTMYGWGVTHCALLYGFNERTWFPMCGMLGAAATVIPAASFDIFVALTFNTLMLWIPMITFLVAIPGPLARIASGSLALYYGLMVLLAVSVRRTQIALLESYERLAEQEAALKKTHAELVRTHSLIRTMLESIDQAFLLFNEQGFCTNAPSEKSKSLLGTDPAQKHLSEILPSEACNRANLEAWVQMIFLDRLEFDEVAAHGPAKTEIGGSTLKLKYHPLRDKEGHLNALIFSATDITQEVKAEQAATAERERAEMILRILDAKAGFQPFLKEFQRVIQVMLDWTDGDIPGLRRDLHTMKGGAMLFGAGPLAQAVYAVEIAILNFGETTPGVADLIRGRGAELQSLFDCWQSDNLALFTQLGVYADQKVEFSVRRMAEAKQIYAQDPHKLALFNKVVERLTSSELGELMREFEMHALTTASKLSKSMRFRIEPLNGPVRLPPDAYRDTFRSFVHLFNNAVDHGLETPKEREAVGKPSYGQITVRYGRQALAGRSWIRILVEDDGGGINLKKLRQSRIDKGDLGARDLPDLELAMCIFEAGVSTREEVTELSGQGVGMGSVKTAIEAAGGRIRILKTDAQGTTFEILLPEVPHIQALAVPAAS